MPVSHAALAVRFPGVKAVSTNASASAHASVTRIIRLELDQVAKRLDENYHVPFTYSGELVNEIGRRCNEVESGARNVDQILQARSFPRYLRRCCRGW
jgi:C-terminal, D2-small domain, of ClpB protein